MAKAIFGSSNFYLQVGDHLVELLREVNGSELSFPGGKIHPPAACLPLITIFQFMEQLIDTQVGEALRLRLDWKYALHLPHNYAPAGMSDSVYCQFRRQAMRETALQSEMQLICQRLERLGLWKDCLYGRPSVVQIINQVCTINRMNAVRQAQAQAVEALAVFNPEWLRSIILPHWYSIYLYANQHSFSPKSYLLPSSNAQTLGTDITYLLQACRDTNNTQLLALPELSHLQKTLHEQYEICQETASSLPPAVHWREQACHYCTFSGPADQNGDQHPTIHAQ